MPKLIDYPRTSYTGAWEVAEIVDDTGGKCALETAARKLNRKVSGSFKAIVGSAVKFGLLTSKRETLTTTTLFRRIKHAYDKQEELLFHREAFLAPPLFTQLCRKFRTRELPVAMLDVLLIREFGVEEINAQGVAKAFVDGARMVGLLDEHNTMADIDQLATQQPPRRELASPTPTANAFRHATSPPAETPGNLAETTDEDSSEVAQPKASTKTVLPVSTKPTSSAPASVIIRGELPLPASRPAPASTSDAIASLFGLNSQTETTATEETKTTKTTALETNGITSLTNSLTSITTPLSAPNILGGAATTTTPTASPVQPKASPPVLFQLQLTGPGINTTLDVVDADDLSLVRALLDKIERRLRQG